MACKLTANITKESCEYQVAGVKSLYLINYNSANQIPVSPSQTVDKITLVGKEKPYKLEFIDNTASWTDDLAVNGNGGKYRTHTVNFTISQYDYTVLNQEKALSLGKFTVVVVDKSGRSVVLGRLNGLSATSFNYASGAAEADANGFTIVMAGTECEVGKLLLNEEVITSLLSDTVTPNITITD